MHRKDEKSPLLKDSHASQPTTYSSLNAQKTVAVSGEYDDVEPINGQKHFHAVVYQRRWWILFVFCLCGLTQSTLWNTWSPIMDAVTIVYDWPDSFVTLLPAMSNAGYVICAFPFMYVVETRGRYNDTLSCFGNIEPGIE